MESIHDSRYVALIEELVRSRNAANVTQGQLAERLKVPQSYVSKVETRERRLDIIELVDWCVALGTNCESVLRTGGFLAPLELLREDAPVEKAGDRHSVVVPVPGSARKDGQHISVILESRGKKYAIVLNNTTTEEYETVEKFTAQRLAGLNNGLEMNRKVIAECLLFAIETMPRCNPSDVYHHVVYRLFLREYYKSDPNQSWARAGGEAVELFIEKKYKKILAARGIVIKALIGKDNKHAAISEMGLTSEVSSSKLDVGLWGRLADGSEVIFGGIHVKASMAERVSDDIPASRAMMAKGFASILFTFDAKSFPPPGGDLVNRGEFGSVAEPSDKRVYIEHQGAFDVALTYNTRIEPSPLGTKSGKRILVSTMEPSEDNLPEFVAGKWAEFAATNHLKPLVKNNAKLP
jgi:transcriptional regulator with XRE-family HTH domain